MTTAFKSERHAKIFDSVLTELKKLGYAGELLKRDYHFGDWFLSDRPQRTAPAAAFGRTPVSYDNACFAVVVPNGRVGGSLVGEYRALGAPFALEVGEREVNVWGVGPASQAERPQFSIPVEGVTRAFKAHTEAWSPDSILRAKNISDTVRPRQLDFIDVGLIPALEEQIRGKLDDLLREVLTKTTKMYSRKTGQKPDEKLLFRLVFRLFAAKVLHDREVEEFAGFTVYDGPSKILRAVGKFYQQHEEVLDQLDAQNVALELIWNRVNFQNLSVEVLAYIYENTLVSQSSRRQLGTHSTPSSIARYLVSRLPFEDYPQNQRIVVEPCSGHAVLLVAAMHRLRELLPPTMDPVKRHQYLVQMLHGFEIDTFALEVGKLCMMLADFPNANGWKLENKDVFTSRLFTDSLRDARFVVCNPPFEEFTTDELEGYGQTRASEKPAELLLRILNNAHPNANLGFVLPRQFTDGRGYRQVREALARRFNDLEIVALPDKIFHVSRTETAILIARSPNNQTNSTTVTFTEVYDKDRKSFLDSYHGSRSDVRRRSVAEVSNSTVLPPLWDIWTALANFDTLGSVAEVHCGVAWVAFSEEDCYSQTKKVGFRPGYSKIRRQMEAFQPLPREYLNFDATNLRRAANLPWDRPKVVVNASRISRGTWRLAAFMDRQGSAFTERLLGIWPRTEVVPLEGLAAILNGPIANAFVFGHERGRDNHLHTLRAIPIPAFVAEQWEQLANLVRAYAGRSTSRDNSVSETEATKALLEIDAFVLSGYGLPAHLERKLLQFFNGEQRPVPFPFERYDIPQFAAIRATGSAEDAKPKLDLIQKRRTVLGNRLLNGTITPDEDKELTNLDEAYTRYVDTVDPLPFDLLERLEGAARRRGFLIGKDD